MTKKPSEETVQAWILLHRVHRLFLDNVENALKNEGLPLLDWYDVLLELHREKSDGLPQYEIGHKVLLSKHNLSRLIDWMEREQLVGRYVCAEDKRGNGLMITDKGEKVLKQIWPVNAKSIQESFGSLLNFYDIGGLSGVLKKLLDKKV